jgi:uncharacterized YigZ family protein
MDHYQTTLQPTEFRHKIERSEFLGVAFHVESDDEFFAELHRIEKVHFDATHHCWGFRLFHDGDVRQRSSDAGEPSGTAGKPILAAIEGSAIYDVGVVVVRWYGGVKLGTGGLTRAYRETATETLAIAPRVDRYRYVRVIADVPFDFLGTIYRMVAPPDVVLVEERYGETNEFVFDVRESVVERFTADLTTRRFTWRRDATPR